MFDKKAVSAPVHLITEAVRSNPVRILEHEGGVFNRNPEHVAFERQRLECAKLSANWSMPAPRGADSVGTRRKVGAVGEEAAISKIVYVHLQTLGDVEPVAVPFLSRHQLAD